MWTDDWRRNLTAVCVGQMCSVAGFTFFIPLLPLFVQSLGGYGVTEAVQWAGAMSAIGAIAMAGAQPFWGAMADRWGRKPMVIRSMVGSGITTLLMAVSSSPEQLTVMYTVQGLVTGTVAACTALVAASVPKRHLGFALGMAQVSVFVGTSIGPLGGGVMADILGYRAAFVAAGGLMVAGALIIRFLVRESFVPPPPAARGEGMWAQWRSMMSLGLFPLLVAIIFLIQFGNTIMGPVISLFIAGLSGGENVGTSVGLVMGAAGAVSAISAFAVGRLGDRIGHTPVLLVCLAGAALSYFPQGLVQQVWQLLLLRMVLGAFLGGLMPAANALVASAIPRERRGAAFGITSSAASLSHAAGPICGAGVATIWGLSEVFMATAVIYGLAFLWAVLSFRKRAPMPESLATAAREER